MNLKIAILFVMGIIGVSFAIPGIPHAFYGSVTVNGEPSPDGVVVSAKIDGIVVATTTTKSGGYGYSPNIFYVDDPQGNRAVGPKTIQFFLNGVDTGKIASFSNGRHTQLDLSATLPIIATPTPSSDNGGSSGGSSGGGGGGGGGGGITSATPTPQTTNNSSSATPQPSSEMPACEEKWSCTEWSRCENGAQTRTCTDLNSCGTDIYEPLKSQPCSTVATNNNAGRAGQSTGVPITAFLLDVTRNPMVGVLIFALIAALVYVVIRKPSFVRKIFGKKEAKKL
jgi:hypothetical protein